MGPIQMKPTCLMCFIFFRYRITNDPGVNFIISRGKVYASPHADLNYETKNVYVITIETTDDGSPAMSYQRNLTVQVTVHFSCI